MQKLPKRKPSLTKREKWGEVLNERYNMLSYKKKTIIWKLVLHFILAKFNLFCGKYGEEGQQIDK